VETLVSSGHREEVQCKRRSAKRTPGDPEEETNFYGRLILTPILLLAKRLSVYQTEMDLDKCTNETLLASLMEA
jgi:hypothetical protein